MSTGTGFVVQRNGGNYLITNRHVLSGRDAANQRLHGRAVDPNAVRILHNSTLGLNYWTTVEEPVIDANEIPLWFEHPRWEAEIDVVALPLTKLEGVSFDLHSLEPPDPRPMIRPSYSLNITGFPFGIASSGGIGVWVQGTVASEPELDYGPYPRFLIDSRIRPGQSGSPVVFYAAGQGFFIEEYVYDLRLQTTQMLVGVYSGRINEESDIGIVWKTALIPEIIDGGVRGTKPAS